MPDTEEWISAIQALARATAAAGQGQGEGMRQLLDRAVAGYIRAKARRVKLTPIARLGSVRDETDHPLPAAFWINGNRAIIWHGNWRLGTFSNEVDSTRIDAVGAVFSKADVEEYFGAEVVNAAPVAPAVPLDLRRHRITSDAGDLARWAADMAAKNINVRDLRAPLIRATWPGPSNTVPDVESAKAALQAATGRGPGRPAG